MDSLKIGLNSLEFYPDEHLYLVNGIEVPSITQMLKVRHGGKYAGVRPDVLRRAADAGTAVHEAIQRFCEDGTESDLPELRGFKFLQSHYGFKVLRNEVPVILFDRDTDRPIAAGRLDLVLEMGGQIGGADIKRTCNLDKDYLCGQLNLYRIAFRQCYGIEWQFLRGVHLREDKRRFVEIPINEELAWEIVDEWRRFNDQH